MKQRRLIGFALAALMLLATGAEALAQGRNVKSIALANEQFVISYNWQGQLTSVGCKKDGTMRSEYRFEYPGSNQLSCVFGIYLGEFSPSTTTKTTFYPSQNKFTETWHLDGSDSDLFYTVTEAGVVCDDEFEATLKWGKDGVSKIEYYGDTQTFKYSGMTYTPVGNFDWLAMALNEVVSDTGFLKYWYTGSILRPFKKYPSEVTQIVNGSKTTIKLDYQFAPGKVVIDVKSVVDGKSTGHQYVTVEFE